MASLELLKEGLIWRIGNGLKVKIWEARWVPKISLLSPAHRDTRLEWVADLFIPDQKKMEWSFTSKLILPAGGGAYHFYPYQLG